MDQKTAPLLSVVLPVYNGEQYIGSMIDCFRAQKVQNFELIFVDDGSEDSTLAMLHSYQRSEAFPMTVVEMEPGGVSAARNAGMEKVRGRYLSFVDVDDRVVPEYTEVLQSLVDSGTAFDLCFFQSERVGPDGPFEGIGGFSGSISVSTGDMLKTIGSDPTKFGVYNMFQDMDFVREHGFRFTEGYAYYEDYDYLFRVVAKAKNIRRTADRLYFYLLQEGSAVATFRLDRLTCISLLERLVPYLKKEAPDFAPMFEDFVLPRIWWSVMWQACLAFSLKDALAFGKAAGMRQNMKKLAGCPDPKVAYSAGLYLTNPVAFVTAASFAGRRRSRIARTDVTPFLEYLKK
ncbi:MAG: glycosyltransferase [Clostridia bacterium]|nr:glycosyltransferase [Clostridia bacterium]MBO7689363.1 glycosyltransferase [Clostridia bacterium]